MALKPAKTSPISNPEYLTIQEATVYLWSNFEHVPHAIKALEPISGRHITQTHDNLLSHLEKAISTLRAINRWVGGKYYVHSQNSTPDALYYMEGFVKGDGIISVKLSTVWSDDVEGTPTKLEDVSCYYYYEETPFDPTQLPLEVNRAYKGPLFEQLLKS
jgi:hypothetical protein